MQYYRHTYSYSVCYTIRLYYTTLCHTTILYYTIPYYTTLHYTIIQECNASWKKTTHAVRRPKITWKLKLLYWCTALIHYWATYYWLLCFIFFFFISTQISVPGSKPLPWECLSGSGAEAVLLSVAGAEDLRLLKVCWVLCFLLFVINSLLLVVNTNMFQGVFFFESARTCLRAIRRKSGEVWMGALNPISI